MLTVDALKLLYVALGGNAEDVAELTLNADVIAKIAEVAAGAGSTLPAVSAEDNGKVLTVVDGAWAAQLPEA